MRDRLRQFLKYQGVTPNRAEEICGFPNGTLQKYLSGKNIGSDKIEKISESFPQLNVRWWFTGIGEMIQTTRDVREGNEQDPIQVMASWMSKMEREVYLLSQKVKLLEKG